MNILYLNHEVRNVFGSSHSLYNLIHALPSHCHAIVVVTRRDAVYDFFVSRGIETWVVDFKYDFCGDGYGAKYCLTFPIRYVRDMWVNSRAISQLVQMCGQRHIDIVHTNSSTIDIGPTLARRLGARHVWHLREFLDLDQGYYPFLGWRRLRRMIGEADAVISITQAIARHFEVSDRANNHTLFDAVRSADALCSEWPKQPYFVFCGNIAPHKCPDEAIRAFARICDRYPDYALHLLGAYDDAYLAQLQTLVPEAALERVIFHGYCQDVATYIRHATALLMCSRHEGMGRVTIEAMLMSCPVIAADAAGTQELITNHSTGLLYDDIEGCMQAMEQLIAHPDEAQRLAREAQQFAAERFLEERYGQQIADIYAHITGLTV